MTGGRYLTRRPFSSHLHTRRDALTTAAAGLLVSTATSITMNLAYPTDSLTVAIAACVGGIPATLAAIALARRRPPVSTPADRVTLTRAVLAGSCATITALVVAGTVPPRTWALVGVAVPTLLLDAVDGRVARRTGTASPAGARFDMELDAGVLLVLCVAAAHVVGAWVLLIGSLRYALIAATWVRPALRTTLPRSEFRRTVAAIQGAVLTCVLVPVVPIGLAKIATMIALGLLLLSFGGEIAAKERHHREWRHARDG